LLRNKKRLRIIIFLSTFANREKEVILLARDAELDRLKSVMDKTFAKQQAAYQELKLTGDRRYQIKQELDISWQKVQAARESMDKAYRENQINWDNYKSQREKISREIDIAKSRADILHSQMSASFDNASNAYNYGNKSAAPSYASEGRRYKEELQFANMEVKQLIARAKSLSLPTDSFRQYQATFKLAQSQHNVVQGSYAAAKNDNEQAKKRFEQAKKDHSEAKEFFQNRLAAIKAEQASREQKNQNILMIVNPEVAFMDGKQVKFKPRNDGTGKIDIYFGGIFESDGYGHGHIVVDDCSNVIYMRQQFKKSGIYS
jgi:predicted  nucleic acid-binding Zn-ribbon protein